MFLNNLFNELKRSVAAFKSSSCDSSIRGHTQKNLSFELLIFFLILSIKFFSFFKVSDVVFIGFRPIGFSINLLSSISPYAAKVKVLGIGVALITNIDGRKPL